MQEKSDHYWGGHIHKSRKGGTDLESENYIPTETPPLSEGPSAQFPEGFYSQYRPVCEVKPFSYCTCSVVYNT